MDARGMKPSAVEKVENYTKVIDLANESTKIYIGWATIGTATSAAFWKIKKITIASSVYTIEWADGNLAFDNVYDNRDSLSYS